MMGSLEEARDRSQEVFAKAFFKIRSLRDDAAFEGWLKRLKVNHCLTALRARGKFQEVPLDEEWDGVETEEKWSPLELDRAAVRDAVQAALKSLSDVLRVTLVMHDMDGLSYAEIADELGIGVSAAKMRVQRARIEFMRAYEAVAPAEYETGIF